MNNKSTNKEKNKAVVLFRYPHKKKINIISGYATAVADFSKVNDGFVLQSFDSKKKYHIHSQQAVTDFELLKKRAIKNTTQTDFVKYIQQIKKEINHTDTEKIVAARVWSERRAKDFHPIDHFKKALIHKEAFVCMVFIESEVCWLCASPELFLKTSDKEIETYSLAGTLKESLDFSEKEKDEQHIVTRYITEALTAIPQLKKPSFSSKISTNGLLNHLLTVVKAKKKKKIHWSVIAEKLHPTPAVGGFPQKNAATFIAKNEGFERSFYSGFLGEIKNGNAKTYVNLRCMEVTKSSLLYYAGCGITGASDPKKEWQETDFKMEVMRNLEKEGRG